MGHEPPKAASASGNNEKTTAASGGILATPRLVCYPTEQDPPPLVPGRADRAWMDGTSDRFAYRCTPLSIANASGWEISLALLVHRNVERRAAKDDILFVPIGNKPSLTSRVVSHFGHGIMTFHTG